MYFDAFCKRATRDTAPNNPSAAPAQAIWAAAIACRARTACRAAPPSGQASGRRSRSARPRRRSSRCRRGSPSEACSGAARDVEATQARRHAVGEGRVVAGARCVVRVSGFGRGDGGILPARAPARPAGAAAARRIRRRAAAAGGGPRGPHRGREPAGALRPAGLARGDDARRRRLHGVGDQPEGQGVRRRLRRARRRARLPPPDAARRQRRRSATCANTPPRSGTSCGSPSGCAASAASTCCRAATRPT